MNNGDFFNKPIFFLLAKECHRRYYLNGDFGKSIQIKSLGKVDTLPLAQFLGYTPLEWRKKKQLSILEFEQALTESILSWTIVDFITFLIKEELILKADVNKQNEDRYMQFLNKLETIDPLFCRQLTDKQLQSWFKKEEMSWDSFKIVADALKNLPKKYTRMPVFAFQQTGDPHAFDEGTETGNLFLQVLTTYSTADDSTEIAETEHKHQLLGEFYLLRDDIKNYVAASGLLGYKEDRNEMWYQACLTQCSWNIPLKEILQTTTIQPFVGNKVLVVENSGVYSILIDRFPDVPIICSSGQFTYAVWCMLRKLVASKTQLYYVGDMDPEGLIMAQKLLKLFPDHAQTIGMSLVNFTEACTEVKLNERRYKKLRAIEDVQLKEIAQYMQQTQTIAMQEGFIELLIEEITEVFVS